MNGFENLSLEKPEKVTIQHFESSMHVVVTYEIHLVCKAATGKHFKGVFFFFDRSILKVLLS